MQRKFRQTLFRAFFEIRLKTAVLISASLMALIATILYNGFVSPFYLLKDPVTAFSTRSEAEFDASIVQMYVYDYLHGLKDFLVQEFSSIKDLKVEKIHLSISPTSRTKLNSDLPRSGRQNEADAILLNEGAAHRAKVRYRGGNFWHWADSAKSWRVSLSTPMQNHGPATTATAAATSSFANSFDLIRPKATFLANQVFTHSLAEKAGVLTQKTTPAYLTVISSRQGFVLKTERVSKEFFARYGLPDGEVYSIDADHFFVGSIRNPWIEPGLWMQTYGKQSEGFSQIRVLTQTLKKRSPLQLHQVAESLLDIDAFNRFYAFTAVFGFGHINKYQNIKYYFNPASQKFSPIGWDYFIPSQFDFADGIYTPTSIALSLHPHWQQDRLNRIWSLINSSHSFDAIEKEFDSIIALTKQAMFLTPKKSSLQVYYGLNLHEKMFSPSNNQRILAEIDRYKKLIKARHSWLARRLRNTFVDGRFVKKKKHTILRLRVRGLSAAKLDKFLIGEGSTVRTVYRDTNFNGVIDGSDQKIEFKISEGQLTVNELLHPGLKIYFDEKHDHTLAWSKYTRSSDNWYQYLLVGSNVELSKVYWSNAVTKERFLSHTLSPKEQLSNELTFSDSIHPWTLKYPIRSDLKLTSGSIQINSDQHLISENAITVGSNTTINVAANVSLKMTGKINFQGRIIGVHKSKVFFDKANQSKFENCHFENINVVINASNDSFFKNCTFTNSPVTLVSSSNVRLSENKFKNAKKTALSLILSQINADKNKFKNSSPIAIHLKNSHFISKNLQITDTFSSAIQISGSSVTDAEDTLIKNSYFGISSDSAELKARVNFKKTKFANVTRPWNTNQTWKQKQ